ncbi:MAG TPA: septal ring lytic transglycosylase RlpA family protein [Acidimicrobiales bacterium]|nr:septal ring lytic transglycosylase RlpA family protein [Acidimicrobiales bacterium]
MARLLTAVALVGGTCAPTSTPPPLLSANTSASTVPAAAAAPPPRPDPPPAGAGPALSGTGRASWYARGRWTASGERFDPGALTTASRTLPFGTRLRVCRAPAGACVEVRVNDRGPAARTGRVLDLSRAAFAAIASLRAGVVAVTWEVVG